MPGMAFGLYPFQRRQPTSWLGIPRWILKTQALKNASPCQLIEPQIQLREHTFVAELPIEQCQGLCTCYPLSVQDTRTPGQPKIPGLCEISGKTEMGKEAFIEHLICAKHLVDMFSLNQAKWVLLIYDIGEGAEAQEGWVAGLGLQGPEGRGWAHVSTA